MTTALDIALAQTVALRLDDRAGCPAWMEAADRRCGKPATVGLLCARHHKVAEKRYEKQLASAAAWRERRRDQAAVRLPKAEAELAEVERRYAALDPSPAEDGAVVNLSLSKRLPSESRIAQLARLAAWRERLVHEISALRGASA